MCEIQNKLLTKESLLRLLESRFCDDKITKLSELPNPSIFVGMSRAVEVCIEAINAHQAITVIGDYDVDGVTSSALMKLFFDHIDYPVEIIIPNRFTDGYGLSANIAKKVQADLVITVDNGIMAHEAANILAGKGAKLIIIDHHTPSGKMPVAEAILHPLMCEPALEVSEVCAATVVWYFLAGLKKVLKLELDLKSMLPLVAIATIADVMPLVCINRTLVRAGLGALNALTAPYATALKSVIKGKITSETIAFQMAPRLNSAGRMSSAMIAYDFLVAKTNALALAKLEELTSLNNERKDIELSTTESAMLQIDPLAKVAVVWGEGWHEGVLGIVASRIVQACKKPAIVLSINGENAKGSARSIGNVSIFELINSASEYLIGFGGHKMAAGVTLLAENLDSFRQKVNETAGQIDEKEFEPIEHNLGEFSFEEIDLELCDILDGFEPYGRANERPRFVANGKMVEKLELVGKEKNVSKLVLRENSSTISGVYFGKISQLKAGERLDFVYQVTKNSWNDISKVEILIHSVG